MRELIKKAFRSAGIKLTRIPPSERKKWQSVSLRTRESYKGQVLLSYRVEPFLNPSLKERHITAWMCVQIAQSFLDRGYNVDVIDYENDTFIPKKNYDIFIDVHSNLERIGPMLNQDCIKVLLIVWAHWLFHNYANYRRHLDLQRRRNLILNPKRQLEPTRSIESADLVLTYANQFTLGTYGIFQKPVFHLPIPSQITCPFPEDKDYEQIRKNYLYFSGFGAVHKGLDLLLEAFAGIPDYHLYVCCRLEDEKDFTDAYHEELFQTPNIHHLGFVDISSRDFIELADRCVGLISPSCSEGGSGAVINCGHAGLIPVISYECGIDVEENSGFLLKNCSIEEIRTSVKTVSSFPSQKLNSMSRNFWEHARKNHTRERFAEEYGKVIDQIADFHASRRGSNIGSSA